MSFEFTNQYYVAQDLFGREDGGYSMPSRVAYNRLNGEAGTEQQDPAVTSSQDPQQPECNLQRSVRRNFSEDFWLDAMRRHCDARQNWRNLLDRYVKPHH